MDWYHWHAGYGEEGPLDRRLAAVCDQINLALTAAASGPIRLISMIRLIRPNPSPWMPTVVYGGRANNAS
jgi:hypothetical protein